MTPAEKASKAGFDACCAGEPFQANPFTPNSCKETLWDHWANGWVEQLIRQEKWKRERERMLKETIERSKAARKGWLTRRMLA